jgi:PAS domain S-box-containing protein
MDSPPGGTDGEGGGVAGEGPGAALPYPYQILDRDGEIRTVNDAWLDRLGYDRADVEGEPFGAFLAPAAADRYESLDPELRARDRVSDVELELVRSDGEHVDVTYAERPEYDDGTVVRRHGQFHGRPGAGTTGEDSDAADELDEVIDALPYPLYVLDVDVDDYTVRRANALATSGDGAAGYETVHEEETSWHEDGVDDASPSPLQEVVETGEPTTVEHIHQGSDGEERVYEVYAAPIVDEEGSVDRMVESVFDITDRVEYERQLKAQRDDLSVLNQVLRHDIRNDLQLVTAYADLLADHVDEAGRGHLETLRESADHVVELTETARDIADVLLSTTDSHGPVDLRNTLERELSEVRSVYTEAAITVDGTVPSVTVRADDMLGSVFRNLLKNAVQHNDKQLAEVTVSVTEGEDSVTVEVADNGPGVPDGQKEMIFGKGEKGLESEGTGIGLYLVQTLVSKYGGTVSVRDNGPEGAVFEVVLPRADSG